MSPEECPGLMQRCRPFELELRQLASEIGLTDEQHKAVAEPGDSEEFKPGRLEDVEADMLRKMKGATWKRAFTRQ